MLKTFSMKAAVCVAVLTSSSLALATPLTYTYSGPDFVGSTDRLVVSFTTTTALAGEHSYMSLADAGVTSASITVEGAQGALPNFTLPLSTFELHTNAAGNIDAWFVFGEVNTLAGNPPVSSGIDWQAYTMNTMAFIPGSDVAGATNLVTGHYMYDQATQTQFYASCTGAPAGCTLAGNGQPYVSLYSGIINPSNTSSASWSVSSVPEPTQQTMILFGLAVLAWTAMRSRQASQ